LFAAKILRFTSENLWNLPAESTQIDCILSCHTAKSFGIYQQNQLKLTVSCSVAQRKIWNLPTKAIQID
jgi:hypothetical protein